MTGDNSTISYNEVMAMKQYAHNLGVPIQDILLDYAGFSTYESCYRAHKVFDLHRAVVITQRYHLPRAVYTCRQLGVKAVGLGTPDREIYGLRGMIPYLSQCRVKTPAIFFHKNQLKVAIVFATFKQKKIKS
jgi:vancomycin permeability regulator SanA